MHGRFAVPLQAAAWLRRMTPPCHFWVLDSRDRIQDPGSKSTTRLQLSDERTGATTATVWTEHLVRPTGQYRRPLSGFLLCAALIIKATPHKAAATLANRSTYMSERSHKCLQMVITTTQKRKNTRACTSHCRAKPTAT